MQAPQVLPSQFVQASTNGQGTYNFNIDARNMLQLPTWATDTNTELVADTISPNGIGKVYFYNFETA